MTLGLSPIISSAPCCVQMFKLFNTFSVVVPVQMLELYINTLSAHFCHVCFGRSDCTTIHLLHHVVSRCPDCSIHFLFSVVVPVQMLKLYINTFLHTILVHFQMINPSCFLHIHRNDHHQLLLVVHIWIVRVGIM